LFLRLFLLFTLVPLLELYALIRLGSLIGAGPTILLVLGTGAAGAWLARREGFRSWSAVQSELAAGRLPAEELLHALVVVIAGVLLVTPGGFTDAFGLLLLIRPVRAAMIRRVRNRIDRGIQSGDVRFWVHEGSSQPGSGTDRAGRDELSDAAEWPGAGGAEHEPRRGRVIDV
jgi:UPF0716 protein FxsA